MYKSKLDQMSFSPTLRSVMTISNHMMYEAAHIVTSHCIDAVEIDLISINHSFHVLSGVNTQTLGTLVSCLLLGRLGT
jgi:hypothetical protein